MLDELIKLFHNRLLMTIISIISIVVTFNASRLIYLQLGRVIIFTLGVAAVAVSNYIIGYMDGEQKDDE